MPNKYPPIIANRFDASLFKKAVHCSHCDSKNVHYRNSRSTLLAGMGKVDPNHVWNYYRCLDCQKNFSHETKSGEAWYVAEGGEVLKGLPNCFETYILKCAYCGGKVDRIHLSFDGQPVTILTTYSDGMKGQAEWFICRECGKKETLDQEDKAPAEEPGIVYDTLRPNVTTSVLCVKESTSETMPDLGIGKFFS